LLVVDVMLIDMITGTQLGYVPKIRRNLKPGVRSRCIEFERKLWGFYPERTLVGVFLGLNFPPRISLCRIWRPEVGTLSLERLFLERTQMHKFSRELGMPQKLGSHKEGVLSPC